MNDKDLIQAERNRMNMYVASLENQLRAEKERSLLFKTKYEDAICNIDKKVEERTTELKEENKELKHDLIEARKELDTEKESKVRLEYAILEIRNEVATKDEKIADLEKKIKILTQVAEAAKVNDKLGADYKSVIRGLEKQLFGSKSEATCFQNDMIDPENPDITDMGIDDMTKKLIAEAKRQDEKPLSDSAKKAEKVASKVSKSTLKPAEKTKDKGSVFPAKKRIYTATEIRNMGLGDLPPGTKILCRKNGKNGKDVWEVIILTYESAKVVQHVYEIARVSKPGEGLFTIGYPDRIIKDNPVHPSFAKFYIESKFGYNLSENRILQILKSMKTSIPQSSLNRWMHEIMEMLRNKLENLMFEAIRQSKTTYNDETRILVRSRVDRNAPFKYKVEYIHAALSLEKKLVAMVYDEGSRSHEVQEKAFFRESDIKLFMADRAPLYSTIVKDLEEYEIERAACWVHSRRLFLNAFLSDERVRPFLKMINAIFWIDKESKRLGHNFNQRQKYRQRHSKKLVDCIFELAKEYRQAGDEYGELVHKALDYILNDEEAFRRFLDHGELEASNNGIENLFRHIAMGRRNWLHIGSHYAAQNIAFMYSLYESCKLNNINFGNYIEDILTRFMYGEEADASFLPNQWVARTPDAGTQTA